MMTPTTTPELEEELLSSARGTALGLSSVLAVSLSKEDDVGTVDIVDVVVVFVVIVDSFSVTNVLVPVVIGVVGCNIFVVVVEAAVIVVIVVVVDVPNVVVVVVFGFMKVIGGISAAAVVVEVVGSGVEAATLTLNVAFSK